MYKLLLIGQGSFYFCNGNMLVAEDNIHFGIKPIGIAADKNLGLWSCRVKPEIFQRFKSKHRSLHILHRVHEQKEPVVPQHIGPFQCQGTAVFIMNKTGMQILQFLNKLILLFPVPVNDEYFVALGYNHIIPVAGTGFISFIRERRLEYQVFTFLQQEEFNLRISVSYLLHQ